MAELYLQRYESLPWKLRSLGVVTASQQSETDKLQTRQKTVDSLAEHYKASEVADTMKMQEHLTLYDDAAAMLAALPSENTYVREALREVNEERRRR